MALYLPCARLYVERPLPTVHVRDMFLRLTSNCCPLQKFLSVNRCISTSTSRRKAGFYKVTPKSDYPLTYDQAQPPYKLGVTKSWNAWNSCSLRDPQRHPMETVIEDQFIRKFILGTWYKVWLSEVIIKRRHNNVIICGVVCPLPSVTTIHFLMGYTEELLSHLLKYNVKVEVQCVPSRKNVIHKYV